MLDKYTLRGSDTLKATKDNSFMCSFLGWLCFRGIFHRFLIWKLNDLHQYQESIQRCWRSLWCNTDFLNLHKVKISAKPLLRAIQIESLVLRLKVEDFMVGKPCRKEFWNFFCNGSYEFSYYFGYSHLHLIGKWNSFLVGYSFRHVRLDNKGFQKREKNIHRLVEDNSIYWYCSY